MNGDDMVAAMAWLRSTIGGLVTGKGDARIWVPEQHIRPLQVMLQQGHRLYLSGPAPSGNDDQEASR